MIERGLRHNAPDLVKAQLPCDTLHVVCDANTKQALADELVQCFDGAVNYRLITLPRKLHATTATTDMLQKECANASAILAVGSGTINDLCKYSSYQLGIPYGVWPTAPSMNGYVSANASLSHNGHKTSYAAHQPAAVWCDIDALNAAPRRMVRAGLGDSLCRPTAQADWLLSHHLLGTPYDPTPFELLAPYEEELFLHADKLIDGDPALTTLLMQTLLASGQGMHVAGSSAPASQGEHMIAHTMEMIYGSEQLNQLHGEQIGVTTLTMARIQHKMLLKRPTIRATHRETDKFVRVFGNQLGQTLHETYHRKALDDERASAINDSLATSWPELRDLLQSVMLSESKLAVVLRKARAKISPSDLNWNNDRFENAVTHAYLSRDRFTFLDLGAMDIGKRYWFGE